MKVVHICSSDHGGAFWAAYNLHLGLVAKGIDSWILVLRKSNHDLFKVVSYLNGRSSLQKVKDSLNHRQYKFRTEKLLKTKPKYLFSFPFSPYNILRHEIVKSADIINLHWVRGFLDYQSFFQFCKKPIVWTLHDKNPFSGGFHFDIYRDPAFERLDRYIIKLKKKAFDGNVNLSIVSPSIWLLNESRSSEILGKFNHYHTPNGVDTEIFCSHDKTEARKELNLPLDKKVVLFVSDSVEDPRKGIQILYDATVELDEKNLLLLTVGGQLEKKEDAKIISLGYIKDKHQLSKIYSAADVFVIPSIEDNLPNTVLESLSCGTPVVGFKIGGILDMLDNKVNGIVVNNIDSKALSNGIGFALKNLNFFDPQNISSVCKHRFNIDLQASKYYILYTSLL